MIMIKYRFFFIFTLSEIAVLCLLVLYSSSVSTTRNKTYFPAMQELVHELQLTDLSLWTEARYTRHPSQADLFSPFQDFPAAMEHFPAGSVIGPVRPSYE